MQRETMRLNDLNNLDQDSFAEAIGFVFEESPWVAAQTWSQRPFASIAQLHECLCATMYAASQAQHLALIRAHPDLVGRAALAGTLTPASQGEQAAAGLDALTPQEVALFAQLNQAYKDNFDFPFIICARENKKDSIVAGFNARLGNNQEQEIATALDEICKIAWFRLQDALI